MSFYDELAPMYDELTGQASRAEAVGQFCDRLVQTSRPAAALDAACGTGSYARALARRDVQVTGADLSAGQLAQARKLAESEDLSIDWVESAFADLPGRARGPFDLALCMGNSLVHVMQPEGLAGALDAFFHVLAPGGVFITTNLNYEKICSRSERIVGVDRNADRQFIRFYDFHSPERIAFNVLRIDWQGQSAETELYTTQLRPWQPDQLAAAMREAGFIDVRSFGGLDFSPFDPAVSDVLLLQGRKPQ